ncbi:MAG: DUF4013 domain-containing protein [Chloroflexi bacterium]|nr:DUF4013 domain-containing protein [Chloroflexota bacterium]
MDIARSFVYMFEDRDWVSKVLIGVVIALAGILLLPLPILSGYLIAIVRNVMRGDETLPNWNDIVRYWVDGLILWVALLVYTLPFWLIPLLLMIPAMFAGGAGSQDLADALGMLSMSISCLSWLALSVVLVLVGPVLIIEYARTGDFGALFRFGRIFGMVRDCFGPILIAAAVSLALAFLVSTLSTVLGLIPCIGWLLALPLAFYPVLVMGHIYGQVARQCPARA